MTQDIKTGIKEGFGIYDTSFQTSIDRLISRDTAIVKHEFSDECFVDTKLITMLMRD